MNERQRRMKKIVERMVDYVSTYDQQAGYQDYSDETFIQDMLYGISLSLDAEKYKFADGYRKFQETIAHILWKDRNK